MGTDRIEFRFEGPQASELADRFSALVETEFGVRPTPVRPQTDDGLAGDKLRGEAWAIAAVVLALPAAILATMDLAKRLELKARVDRLLEWARETLKSDPEDHIAAVSPKGRAIRRHVKGQMRMSRTKLSIEDGQLLFCCEDAGVDDRRPLEGDDHGRFEQWGTAYRHACGQRDAAEKLLELGREMFDWLDGGGRWIERARAAARPPWLVEFSVALHPSVVEGAFLEAPWELLADGADHLAADTELIYCPIRRLAPPAEPEPPSESRLSMVFMAAAPEEQVTLSYEAEEAAILRATGSIGLDLTVEETGTLPLLGECVARESLSGRLDVLHISCHGTLDPEPRLLLEDDEGGPAPATAEEVCDTLGEHRPRLLCLSACETAASDRLLGSLAAGMIRRGFPAVLGWSGKVRDAAATEFAADLYAQLARFQPLETALARARLKLLRPQPGALEKKRSEDWHLARLFLGPGGGGVLCRGTRARHRRDAEYAYKTFLNERDQQVPVAGINEFVGRRRQIQRVLRVFRQGSHAGVLVHGMGRQGKSSLAARIAHRLHQHTLVVLHGAYDAQTVLRAFDRFVRGDEVRAIVGRHEAPVGDDPAVLYQALCELLEGPCRQYVHPSADGG